MYHTISPNLPDNLEDHRVASYMYSRTKLGFLGIMGFTNKHQNIQSQSS